MRRHELSNDDMDLLKRLHNDLESDYQLVLDGE